MEKVYKVGGLVIVVVELLSLILFIFFGEFGVDIVVGNI